MKIVICICTRYRPKSLKHTLTSIDACHLDSHEAEVLIIANENDGITRQALQGMACAIPIRIIEEPRPGIAHARNAALSYLLEHYPPETLALWTDDDVVVDRNWLASMANTASQYGKKYIYGGRIIPVPPENCKGIWTQHLITGKYKSPLYSDYQPLDSTAEAEIIPFGPNFAFYLSSVNGQRFSTNLGLGANALGEETKFLRRLTENGHGIIYCHEAAVKHMLREVQLSKAWIINRAAQWGRAEALQMKHRFTAEKMARRIRKYAHRLRAHQVIALLLSFSGLLSINHKIRMAYYKAFLDTAAKTEE